VQLDAGRYVGAPEGEEDEVAFEERMAELVETLEAEMAKNERLAAEVRVALARVGALDRPPNRVTHPRGLVIVHEVKVKERLHEVVDAMTEEEAAETLRAPETTRDPLARILAV